jgi:hypothetical protein
VILWSAWYSVLENCRPLTATSQSCQRRTTCDQCISNAEELCVWCEDLRLLETKAPRCNVAANYTNGWCKATVYPHSAILGKSEQKAGAQVYPESYNLKMNPGLSFSLLLACIPRGGTWTYRDWTILISF